LAKYRQVSVRGAVGELIVSGHLMKIGMGSKVLVKLTTIGKEVLKSDFANVVGGMRKWDGHWRMILVKRSKLNESQKRRLRFSSSKMGFRSLLPGVYVSAKATSKEIDAMLGEVGIRGLVNVIETNRFLVGEDQLVAKQLWRLSTIYNKYQNLISLLDRLLYRVNREKTLTYRLKKWYIEAVLEWSKLLKMDPGLPKQLVGDDWPRLEAEELVAKIAKSVRELETSSSR